MKKANKISSKSSSNLTLATLCVVAAGLMAVQAQDAYNGDANRPPTANSPQQKADVTTEAPGQPQKMNKCSDLIGSAVQNQQGEKLGKIEDVVVNFDNGHVAYCVLSVEKGIFSTPKYLAIPLNSLRPSADGTALILNADKDKVAQAQGFDRNDWPSVTNPAWGAQPFWKTTPKATITSPPNTAH